MWQRKNQPFVRMKGRKLVALQAPTISLLADLYLEAVVN
jgi:hypothetical protein